MHLAVWEIVGMFDISGLCIIEVSGADAAQFMDYLCANEMDKPVGQVVYTLSGRHGVDGQNR